MKSLFTIIICCFFLSCTFEREIQIEKHYLSLSQIDTVRRAFMLDELKLIWLDEERVKYWEFVVLNPYTRIYKVGDIDTLKLRR